MTPPEAYATPEMHSMKSYDNLTKDTMSMLPAGNLKMVAEKCNDEKLALHIWSLELGWLLTIFGEIKMAGILRTIFGAGINALGFAGTNYAFSKSGSGEAEAEHKHHDLAEKKLQKA